MSRTYVPPASDPDWVGKRVVYTPRGEEHPAARGVVLRMATGKTKAMFVQYDEGGGPKLTYASDLKLEVTAI